MLVRLKCPACGKSLNQEVFEPGQTIVCTACGSPFVNPHSLFPAPKPDPTPVTLTFPDPIQPAPVRAAKQLALGCGVIALITIVLLGAELMWLRHKTVAHQQAIYSQKPTALPWVRSTKPKFSDRNPTTSVAPALSSPIERLPPTTRVWSIPTTLPSAPQIAAILPPPATTEPILIPAQPPFHPVRALAALPDLDDRIGQSIERGVGYLLKQFNKAQLRLYSGTSGVAAGEDALAVYALLQAGEATHDRQLGPNSPLVDQMLNALKAMDMNHDHAVYARSLRSAALSVYHRQQDKAALRLDANWLMHADFEGAYTYEPIPAADRSFSLGKRVFAGLWDNSNSQYGALGVWAAEEAGVEVPSTYWNRVQRHWLACQQRNGEWGYAGYAEGGEHSMTVAGITTLFVTQDELDARAVVATVGHEPFTPALRRGLDWLEAGSNSVSLASSWRTYDLFGLERAALASGFKYFGTHDWYRELALEQLQRQQPDGSWSGYESTVDTAYTLLFLSRGRHPIFMNKLRFDGYWANRPRDIANLSHYAAIQLERPLNWQVVSLQSDWVDWMDSPVLYIASHEALKLTPGDIAKLRAYALAGGLIFTQADGDSSAFNAYITLLSERLFPEYKLETLPANHPIYSTLYKIKPTIRLAGVSNGSRLLLLHSPTDLSKAWQQQDWIQWPNQFQMGVNIFIYSAGKADLRNKLKTTYVPEPAVTPIRTMMVAQLRHPGNWNPEPAAFERFSRLFLKDTGAKIESRSIDPLELDAATIPIARLTGTDAMRFTPEQLKKIRGYVLAGGTLLIDACGGSPAFNKSVVTDLLPHAFPDQSPERMKPTHPILLGAGDGMSPANLHLRPYHGELDGLTTMPLDFFLADKGMVIISQVDITTGLLGTDTWPVNGYAPEAAYDLVRNIMLYTMERK